MHPSRLSTSFISLVSSFTCEVAEKISWRGLSRMHQILTACTILPVASHLLAVCKSTWSKLSDKGLLEFLTCSLATQSLIRVSPLSNNSLRTKAKPGSENRFTDCIYRNSIPTPFCHKSLLIWIIFTPYLSFEFTCFVRVIIIISLSNLYSHLSFGEVFEWEVEVALPCSIRALWITLQERGLSLSPSILRGYSDPLIVTP